MRMAIATGIAEGLKVRQDNHGSNHTVTATLAPFINIIDRLCQSNSDCMITTYEKVAEVPRDEAMQSSWLIKPPQSSTFLRYFATI